MVQVDSFDSFFAYRLMGLCEKPHFNFADALQI